MYRVFFLVLSFVIFLEANAFSSFAISTNRINIHPGERVFLASHFVTQDHIPYRLKWEDNHADGKFIFDNINHVIWESPNKRTEANITATLVDFYGNVLSDSLKIKVEFGHTPIARDDINIALMRANATLDINTTALLSNDYDPDGDIIKVIKVSQLYGDLSYTLNKDRTKIKIDPKDHFSHLANNDTTQVKFQYTISDGKGNTAEANASFNILGVDDDPILTNDLLSIKLPQTQASINILKNDKDPDDGHKFELYKVNTTIVPSLGNVSIGGHIGGGRYGHAEVSKDGNITYIVNSSDPDIIALSHGESINDYIYNISTLETQSSVLLPQDLTINIQGQNNNPIAVDDSFAAISPIIKVDDFESNALGWSPNNRDTSASELSSFLGRFGGSGGLQEVSKTFDFGLENRDTVVQIEFDFFEIDSWDGEKFIVFANNRQLSVKHYRCDHNNNENGGTFTSTNLFTGWGAENIHRYKLYAKTDETGKVKLGFGSTLNQPIDDESYGIDNVKITLFPLTITNKFNTNIQTNKILSNDSDPDGDDISLKSVGDLMGDNGSILAHVNFNAAGVISFVANDHRTEENLTKAYFKYTIIDQNGGSDEANVTLNYIDNQISVTDDFIDLYDTRSTPKEGNIFLNDVNEFNSLKVVNPSNDINGTYGWLEINQDGRYKYHYNTTNAKLTMDSYNRDIFTINVRDIFTGMDGSEKIYVDTFGSLLAVDDNITQTYGEWSSVDINRSVFLNNDYYNPSRLTAIEVNGMAYIKGTTTEAGTVTYDVSTQQITYTPIRTLPKLATGETREIELEYTIKSSVTPHHIIDNIHEMNSTAKITLNTSSIDVFLRCPNGTQYDGPTQTCLETNGTAFSDFNTWNATTSGLDGNWTVIDGGNKVHQNVNASKPTLFLSPNSYGYLSFTGKMEVYDHSDDDFIGFGFGYNNGKYILFDWRNGKGDEDYPNRVGYALTRMVPGGDSWNHNGSATLLQSNFGAGKNWVPDREYTIEVSYSKDNVKVKVDGVEVIDYTMDGSYPETPKEFPVGQIGFYNLSQGNVTYHTFRIIPYDCIGNGYGMTPDKTMCYSQ